MRGTDAPGRMHRAPHLSLVEGRPFEWRGAIGGMRYMCIHTHTHIRVHIHPPPHTHTCTYTYTLDRGRDTGFRAYGVEDGVLRGEGVMVEGLSGLIQRRCEGSGIPKP